MGSKTGLRSAFAVSVIAAVAALAPAPIRAAEEAAPSSGSQAAPAAPDPHGRVVNGHAFIPAFVVPGALVTTSFVSGLLVGLGETKGTFQLRDQTLTGNFEYAGIGAVIGYEYAFTDWLSARFALTELLFSGTTGRSAIVVGTQLQAGAGLGVTASLPVGDTLRLAALFDVTAAPNFGLTIGNGLRGVIDTCNAGSCDVGAGNFFQQRNVTQVQPALAASWAPSRALGVTANATYAHATQHLNGTTFDADAISLGAALDYDFAAISSVPIGLLVEFNWTAPFNGSALQHVSDLGGGIFYTGRRNLALGVQVIDRRFAVTPDVDVSWKTLLVDVGMRYYW